MFDQPAIDLIDKGLLGKPLTSQQLASLLELETFSPEAAYARWAGRHLARVASGATAQVYAQIQLDALPCPGNSAAAAKPAGQGVKRMITHPDGTHEMVDVEPQAGESNQPAQLTPEQQEALILPVDQAASLAHALSAAGVHLISLRCSAALPFDRYLEAVTAVRAAVKPSMPLMAHRADLTAKQTQQLAQAGVQAVYQALVPGACFTEPDHPLQNAANARTANLQVMAGIENAHRGTSAADLLAALEQAIDLQPFCVQVVLPTGEHNAPAGAFVPVSAAQAELIESIGRLMAGVQRVKHGLGGGNVAWVRTGIATAENPLAASTELATLSMQQAKSQLAGQEWSVPAQPLPQWFPATEQALRQIASAPVAYKPVVASKQGKRTGPPTMPSGPRPGQRLR